MFGSPPPPACRLHCVFALKCDSSLHPHWDLRSEASKQVAATRQNSGVLLPASEETRLHPGAAWRTATSSLTCQTSGAGSAGSISTWSRRFPSVQSALIKSIHTPQNFFLRRNWLKNRGQGGRKNRSSSSRVSAVVSYFPSFIFPPIKPELFQINSTLSEPAACHHLWFFGA